MKNKVHRISEVAKDSIAMELGIESGDILLEINGKEIVDIFDYHFLVNDDYIELLVEKPNKEEWLLEIEKDYQEDLGLSFENSLMDEYRSCTNRCIFCFIDQMPPGMRETLYFKDDDSRLSFLQGNYVTLTNMSDQDVERIIQYHLSPINISVHTTNPKLRCEMLHNRFAGQALEKVKRLYDAGIEMNGQIVLCKGINDGVELENTIRDLSGYYPHMKSLSVVPVGLSRYREGLHPLESFGKGDAQKVLEIIHRWQNNMIDCHGIHFVHGSDEWYLLGEEQLPEELNYDGYPQLENGVGMLRLLCEEIAVSLEEQAGDKRAINCTIATGRLAGASIGEYLKGLEEKYPNVKVQIRTIENEFFGSEITVAGLITGGDLLKQLKDQELGEKLLIPCHMLRSGEEVFLDDVTVSRIEAVLGIPVVVVDERGSDLIRAILEPPVEGKHRRRQIYEQTDCSNCGQA